MRLLPKRACLWMRNRALGVTDTATEQPTTPPEDPPVIASNEPSLELTLPVNNLLGLHAGAGRPICADCRAL